MPSASRSGKERSKEDWLARIEPLLPVSLDEAGERITAAPEVQQWLPTASMEAAVDLGGASDRSDMEVQATAYHHLLAALRARFPALAEAVREATAGFGRLALHWRPLAPQYSAVRINFGSERDVDVFCRLSDDTPEAAAQALGALGEALPRSLPFPKRPNRARGLVVWQQRDLLVEMIDRLTEGREGGGRERRVTLRPRAYRPLEHLTEPEAAQAVAQYFRQVEAEE